MQFFTEMGALALGSRLKRLSDLLVEQTRNTYERKGLAFEPRWFPVFRLSSRPGGTTVIEAASLLGFTHPHVSAIAREMVAAGIAEFRENPADGRSRILSLTGAGRRLQRELEPTWSEIRRRLEAKLKAIHPDFLEHLGQLEASLAADGNSTSSADDHQTSRSKDVGIEEYRPGLRKHFERLNREWLEKYFQVEGVDRKYFANPKKEIIDRGGEIFFVTLAGEVVGTGALLKDGGHLELAKMAVTPAAQGRGLGRVLVEEGLRRARARGESKLVLVTNTRLVPAISLYRKLGFKEVFRGQHPKYKRGDLVMERDL